MPSRIDQLILSDLEARSNRGGDTFLVLVLGDRVSDDAGAGLHIHLAVLDDRGPQHDPGVHRAVGREVAEMKLPRLWPSLFL